MRFSVRVRAVDTAMTTVEEWRESLDAVHLPAATDFLAACPYVKADFTTARDECDRAQAALQRALMLTKDQPAAFDPMGIEIDPVAGEKAAAATALGVARSLLGRPRDLGPTFEEVYDWHCHCVEEAKRSDGEKDAELQARDRAECGKRGDLVDVGPSGHQWTENETSPYLYVILQVEAKRVEDFAPYLAPETEDAVSNDGEVWQRPVRHRAHGVDVDQVNPGQVFSFAEFEALVQRKK